MKNEYSECVPICMIIFLCSSKLFILFKLQRVSDLQECCEIYKVLCKMSGLIIAQIITTIIH